MCGLGMSGSGFIGRVAKVGYVGWVGSIGVWWMSVGWVMGA